MILVNLLPHREEMRKRRKQAFLILLGMAAGAGLILGGLVWKYYDFRIDTQERVNKYIQAENAKLDSKIKEVQGVEAEIAALRDRQQAVESLQQERNDPVKLFNELAAKMPDGMYFTSLKQSDATVNLEGVAQSNERVSEFLRNLRDSPLFAKQPQLEQTLVQEISLSNKGKSRAYGFKMVLTLKKPQKPEFQKAAPGKSARVPAAASKK